MPHRCAAEAGSGIERWPRFSLHHGNGPPRTGQYVECRRMGEGAGRCWSGFFYHSNHRFSYAQLAVCYSGMVLLLCGGNSFSQPFPLVLLACAKALACAFILHPQLRRVSVNMALYEKLDLDHRDIRFCPLDAT